MNLPEFSVRHSIFGNMLTLVVLVAGVLIVSQMQREVFPEISLDVVTITTAYPSASPEEVEDLITIPIEDALKDVDGINKLTSSSIEGVSVVVVEIEFDARDKDRVINEVQRKVDQITDFPAEALDPEIRVLTMQGPIIRLAVGGDVPETQIREVAAYLEARLEQHPLIGSVIRNGWRDEEFWVEIDPAKLEELEISVLDVSQALAAQNLNMPGGKLRLNARELVVRTIGQFYTAEEITQVIVRSDPDGNHIRVADLATVQRTFEEDTIYLRANGSRSVLLGVKKKSQADSIHAVNAVREIVSEERERLPAEIVLTLVDDESYYVKRRLQVLSMNGLLGMAFVMVCLFVFLNFRVALITSIGIPFSFLSAFLLMEFYGVTINLMTMFGLIMVLGMVVDDAIIVGENIYRHLEMGKSPKDAAIDGTREVMYPVITTVLTTCAAFFPLMFAPDLYSEFLKWLPIVVMMTLAGSLFESLVILPCHAADFVPAFKPGQTDPTGKHHAHRWMDGMIQSYSRGLNRVLHWRYLFLALVLGTFVGLGFFAAKKMRIDIFPADMIDIFIVRLSTEEGTVVEKTEAVAIEVERVIGELPPSELLDIITHVGGHFDEYGGYMSQGSHYAAIAIYLTPQNTRERKTRDIMDSLREPVGAVEGLDKVEFAMLAGGPPVGRPIEVKIIGRDFEVLKEISDEIQAFLQQQPGVSDITDDFEAGKDEAHIRLDTLEAARLGLDVRSVAQTVAASFRGIESTVIREGKDEVAVRVRLAEPYRNHPETIDRVRVRNQHGRLIPVSSVASIEREQGLPTIYHYMGDRVVTVGADIDTRITSSVEVNRAILQQFGDLHVQRPGFRIMLTGEWEETAKLVRFIGVAFTIATLVIFSILVVQFNSLGQPFVVIVAIPLGLIGVTLALIAHGQPISVMAMMGMVGLGGVAVNDAIVLVNFINQRRREGIEIHEAVHQASQTRLRPILLTTVTTMTGLLPVIYGWGGYEPFIAPAAITLGYGLLFASFLTLFVVPSLYYVAYDLKRALRIRKNT